MTSPEPYSTPNTVLSRLYLASLLLLAMAVVAGVLTLLFRPLPYPFFLATRNTQVLNVLPLGLDTALGFGIRPDFNRQVSTNVPGIGWLPTIEPQTGQTPLNTYRDPASDDNPKTGVVMVVFGLGLSKSVSLEATQKLPAAVTFAFSPYTENLQEWLFDLRQNGSEVLLQLSLSAEQEHRHAGPLDISAAQMRQNDRSRLWQTLAAATGYAAVQLPADNDIARWSRPQANLLTELATRGLGVLDFSELPGPGQLDLPENIKLHYVKPDTIIYRDTSLGDIATAIAQIKRTTQQPRSAAQIVAFEASPMLVETAQDLHRWMAQENIPLVPLSSLLLAQ